MTKTKQYFRIDPTLDVFHFNSTWKTLAQPKIPVPGFNAKRFFQKNFTSICSQKQKQGPDFTHASRISTNKK